MASTPVPSTSTASRWWKHNSGIAVCDIPYPSHAEEASTTSGERSRTLRCPRHGHPLPCDPCVARDHEASTAGWVIGLLGMLVAMLLALSMVGSAEAADGRGQVALVLTLLSMAGAIAVGLLVAQTYGGEPIGVEVTCPECGSRFVWAAAQSSAPCPECSKRITMERGEFALLH